MTIQINSKRFPALSCDGLTHAVCTNVTEGKKAGHCLDACKLYVVKPVCHVGCITLVRGTLNAAEEIPDVYADGERRGIGFRAVGKFEEWR